MCPSRRSKMSINSGLKCPYCGFVSPFLVWYEGHRCLWASIPSCQARCSVRLNNRRPIFPPPRHFVSAEINNMVLLFRGEKFLRPPIVAEGDEEAILTWQAGDGGVNWDKCNLVCSQEECFTEDGISSSSWDGWIFEAGSNLVISLWCWFLERMQVCGVVVGKVGLA